MARTFAPEEIAEMKAFLRAHPSDPAYDEEAELFDGKLPFTEFEARCVRDILENLGELPVGFDTQVGENGAALSGGSASPSPGHC